MTFRVPKNISVVILLLISGIFFAQKLPTFNKGEDPKPLGKKWELIKNMSDEFDGKKIDTKKWQISGQGWIGRPPGLFLAKNIEVANGSLQIITTKLPKTIIKNNNEFTYGGGYVGSKKGMKYGYYECEMRANKTFMSSTFWLINENKGVKECDKRTTELDIQECVGEITNAAAWMKYFDQAMNSNTHSRNIPDNCNYIKGTAKARADTSGKVYDDFHVYGVWWKSKDEIIFYLDGKKQSTVKPTADFDLEMHIRLVVETYDWNKAPANGGMNKSKKDRTTTYNWVRSWQLVD